jgi:hypothetical protein
MHKSNSVFVMRDRRFILILAAVAMPIAAWLSFEAMVAPAQPEKGVTGKKLHRPEPLPAPAVAPQTAQPTQLGESPAQSTAALPTTPPRPEEAATSVSVRQPKAKAKSKAVSPDMPPAQAGNVAASTAVVAPATAPKPPVAQAKPRSPEELCADRANFVTRGLCESRACATAEWSAHPSCVKRRELEERSRPASIMGGGN